MNKPVCFIFRYMLIIFLLITIGLLIGCSAENGFKQQPVAEKGVIDISSWNFRQQGIITLDGAWEFYWHQLLAPTDFNYGNQPQLTGYREVPGIWNKYKVEAKQLPGYGYATYRLIIKTDETGPLKFIKFRNISSSYKLWVNGQLKAVNGVVSKTKEKQVPQRKEEVVALPKNSERIELVIQISNFFYKDGGFKTDWKNIQLGTKDQINDRVKRELTFDMFVCGSLLMMAFYHIFHYLIARHYLSSFYFGLLCLLVAVRNLSFSNAFFVIFPINFPFWLRVKLEFFTAYLGTGVFATYVYSLFLEDINQKIIRFFQILIGFMSLIVLIFPIRLYEWTLYVMHPTIIGLTAYLFMVVVVIAWQKREQNAVVLVIGFFCLLAAATNDVLLMNHVISSTYLVHYGMFVFIFSQSVVLIFEFNEVVRKFELERQKRIIAEKLRQITNVLVSNLNFEDVLDKLLISLAEMVSYKWAVVLLKEEEELTVKAVRGNLELTALKHLNIKIENSEFFQQVITDFEPQVINRDNNPSLFAKWGLSANTVLSVPLLFQNEVEGVLMFGSDLQKIYDSRAKDVAAVFAGQAAISIKNAQLFNKVRKMAEKDDLTGLYNRRTFFRLAKNEFLQAEDEGYEITAIMLDIDHFKQFNDQYGHAVGDKVLTAVAEKCQKTVRNRDIVGRYGGEEFVVLLPKTSLEAGKKVAVRLRKAIEEEKITLDSGEQVGVTASEGVACLGANMDLADLLKTADEALYTAKEAGRNCVKVYSELEE